MGNAARTQTIKQCNRELIDCFSECARNVLKGNVPLKKRQFTRLQRRKKDLRALANARTSLKKKKLSYNAEAFWRRYWCRQLRHSVVFWQTVC